VRGAIFFTVGVTLLAATAPVGIETMAGMVRAAVGAGQDDKKTAKQVSKLKLSERLEDRVIEELESLGAGRRTVEELILLRDASAGMPEAAAALGFPHDEMPSQEEQRRIVYDARDNALSYLRSLPDFICHQAIRRSEYVRDSWWPKDLVDVKLTFFDQKETYQLQALNGRNAPNKKYREIGGAITEGEFGTLLRHTFEPASQAEFRWHHWTTLRKRPAHVFSYKVLAAHSTARLEAFRPGGARYNTVVGQHGFVYVDRDTHVVLRIVAESDSMPRNFPVKSSTTYMDYDFAEVGGQEYLLPLRAEIRMATAEVSTRNLVEFREYRKYTASSSITYGVEK
jgi:hypothetical protein